MLKPKETFHRAHSRQLNQADEQFAQGKFRCPNESTALAFAIDKIDGYSSRRFRVQSAIRRKPPPTPSQVLSHSHTDFGSGVARRTEVRTCARRDRHSSGR